MKKIESAKNPIKENWRSMIGISTTLIILFIIIAILGEKEKTSSEYRKETARVQTTVKEYLSGTMVDPDRFPWNRMGRDSKEFSLQILDDWRKEGRITEEQFEVLKTPPKVFWVLPTTNASSLK